MPPYQNAIDPPYHVAMGLYAELRKRKVFQVAAGYLAVAWLLLQVTATILPAFDLPVWTLRLVILLFALGFPIAVLMAWTLELTPEGVKLDVSASGSKRMLTLAVVLIAVALGWFFRDQLHPTLPAAQPVAHATVMNAASPQPKPDERSIAVLPLVNASDDPEQQFFADGLSENLIDTLSRFDGLKVIGRMSSFQFHDGKGDSASIGHKLGVAYLLSGSVQHAGEVVRISASLIKAADGSTLWAEHYDRPYKNLFALQDEIAHAVTGALRVKLLSPETAAQQDDRPLSGNMEAYNAYLQGRKIERDDGFGFKANQAFARAVQLDPSYAAAWAHLSGTWTGIAQYWDNDPSVAREHLLQARHAVDKALQLAPDLGIAYVDRAWVLAAEGSDARNVLNDCHRALQLAENNGAVLFGCSWLMARYGNLREAIRLREHLLSVEPLIADNYPQYALMLMSVGRLNEAERFERAGEALGQTDPYGRILLALLNSDVDAATAIAAQTPADPRSFYTALAAQAGSDRVAADEALAALLADSAYTQKNPYQVAQVYALRGDADNTLQWLERTWAMPRRMSQVRQYLLNDPLILRFRDDPRLIAYCKKIGLPAPTETDALNIDQIRGQSASAHPPRSPSTR